GPQNCYLGPQNCYSHRHRIVTQGHRICYSGTQNRYLAASSSSGNFFRIIRRRRVAAWQRAKQSELLPRDRQQLQGRTALSVEPKATRSRAPAPLQPTTTASSGAGVHGGSS
ncbi:unnamed protein product, partial [Staurois parvus]